MAKSNNCTQSSRRHFSACAILALTLLALTFSARAWLEISFLRTILNLKLFLFSGRSEMARGKWAHKK